LKHSLLRAPGEEMRLFVHVEDTSNINTNLVIYKFNSDNTVDDITPQYNIFEISENRYATDIKLPNEICYLLIKFYGQPIVLRVGNPTLTFFYYNEYETNIPFIQRNKNGVVIQTGYLEPAIDSFYYYVPSYTELSYIDIFDHSVILDIPYCSNNIEIYSDIIWNKKIIQKKFGIKTNKFKFKINNYKNINFRTKILKIHFKFKSENKKFKQRTINQIFYKK